jgi:hypothetical protein
LLTTSELIASVLLTVRLLSLDFHNVHLMIPAQAKKDRCAALYGCIHAHIVALCACKTGSKVIWLLYVRSSLTHSRAFSSSPATGCTPTAGTNLYSADFHAESHQSVPKRVVRFFLLRTSTFQRKR